MNIEQNINSSLQEIDSLSSLTAAKEVKDTSDPSVNKRAV